MDVAPVRQEDASDSQYCGMMESSVAFRTQKGSWNEAPSRVLLSCLLCVIAGALLFPFS